MDARNARHTLAVYFPHFKLNLKKNWMSPTINREWNHQEFINRLSFIAWEQLSVPLNSTVAQSFLSILNAISYCEIYKNCESKAIFLVLAFAHASTIPGICYGKQYFCLSSILSLSIQSERIAAHSKRSRQRRTNKSGKRRIALVRIFYFYFSSSVGVCSAS